MRQSKFHAQKVTVGGITFASKHEAARWQDLKILERAGLIEQLKRQVKFDLIPFQNAEKGMPSERGVQYVADFTYLQNGKLVVEDAKGYKTPEYIIKRKLMRWVHGISVREV